MGVPVSLSQLPLTGLSRPLGGVKELATPSGFEPPISTLTGWHVRPLHHGAPNSLILVGRPLTGKANASQFS